MKPVYQRQTLYLDGNESYIFVPTEPVGAQSLTIHRGSGDLILNRPNTPVPTGNTRFGKPIYGILGLISLSLSEYVVVITGRELKGPLMGHAIYRAVEFDILPLNPNASVSHPPHPVEGHLLALLKSHLYGGLFLFSYGWDLTRRLQAQWETQEADSNKSLWEVADDRFFWNRFMQTRLIDATTSNPKDDLSPYILPIMYGTFDLRSANVLGRRIQLLLTSRRSRHRAGTRYFRRGIDHEGNVANFNETEQLVLVEGKPTTGQRAFDEQATKLSFVQIRGSVPVYWAEINTLRYKPDLQVMDLPDTTDAMRLHLQKQVDTYGEQVLVNLVNQKGHEQPVKEAYERHVAEANVPGVRYQYFDFHNECKNMRWDRISVLIDKTEDDLTKHGYFQADATQTNPTRTQKGVVRSNCMDNLDRTNVVQSALGKRALNEQLQALGVLSPTASIDDFESLAKDFREMWADHADFISRAYAGSGALKTDFTRTAQRTKKGALEDGYKSVLRYLKNNYFDGPRQDAYDLVTGAWIPRKNPSASLFLIQDNRPLLIRSAPYLMSGSLFMVAAGLTLPRTSDYSLFYYFLLWFSLLALAVTFIFIHGIEYVSWPKLNPLTEQIYYTGPGFRGGHHGKGLGKNAGKVASAVAGKLKRVGEKVPEIELGHGNGSSGHGGKERLD